MIHGQQPAIDVLKEIQLFLEANPSEVITIFIEDYVTSPKGLTKVFNASGLMKYWFPVERMPKNGGDWPLLGDMISRNERLLVFTSKAAKEASEGIAYEWRYVVENQCEESSPNPSSSSAAVFCIIGCWCLKFCRRRWWNGSRFLPEPSRVIAHERDVEISGFDEPFPFQSRHGNSVQAQFCSSCEHAEYMPRFVG